MEFCYMALVITKTKLHKYGFYFGEKHKVYDYVNEQIEKLNSELIDGKVVLIRVEFEDLSKREIYKIEEVM